MTPILETLTKHYAALAQQDGWRAYVSHRVASLEHLDPQMFGGMFQAVFSAPLPAMARINALVAREFGA